MSATLRLVTAPEIRALAGGSPEMTRRGSRAAAW